MIFGIGVDIAETARIARLLADYRERFARRILTEREFDEFKRRQHSVSYLATRFAAKEAVAKALGTGMGGELGFHSVQIENDHLGKPRLRFFGTALERVDRLRIHNALISLSDEKNYVVAMVVLEAKGKLA